MNQDPGEMVRLDPDDDWLDNEVMEQMEAYKEVAQPFTAYDVTRKLRSDNPDIEVTHHHVRSLVASLFSELGLDRAWRLFTTGGAWEYSAVDPEGDDPEEAEHGSAEDGPSSGDDPLDLAPGIAPA